MVAAGNGRRRLGDDGHAARVRERERASVVTTRRQTDGATMVAWLGLAAANGSSCGARARGFVRRGSRGGVRVAFIGRRGSLGVRAKQGNNAARGRSQPESGSEV